MENLSISQFVGLYSVGVEDDFGNFNFMEFDINKDFVNGQNMNFQNSHVTKAFEKN